MSYYRLTHRCQTTRPLEHTLSHFCQIIPFAFYPLFVIKTNINPCLCGVFRLLFVHVIVHCFTAQFAPRGTGKLTKIWHGLIEFCQQIMLLKVAPIQQMNSFRFLNYLSLILTRLMI